MHTHTRLKSCVDQLFWAWGRPWSVVGGPSAILLKKLIVPLPAALPCKQSWLEMGWGLCIHSPFPVLGSCLVWTCAVLSFLSQSFWVCVCIHSVVSRKYFLGVICCLGLLCLSAAFPRARALNSRTFQFRRGAPESLTLLILVGLCARSISSENQAMHWSIGIVIDH